MGHRNTGLRGVAALVGLLGLIATWLGMMPARFTTRDLSNCFLTGMFEDPTMSVHPCARDYVAFTLPAVDIAVVVALVVIVVGAASVCTFPRRVVAWAWLGCSAVAGFLAFVVTRGWTVRHGETIAAWPWYATWAVVTVLATTMFAVLIWLIMTDGISVDVPPARVVRRRAG